MTKRNPITWTAARAVWIAVPMACFAGIAAHAATPTVYLQDSTIVGSGGTLTITRLPLSNGTSIVYDDVTIPFSVGPTGTLTVDTPTVVPSPITITSHFLPGTYAAVGGAKDETIKVAGPNAGQGGSTVWSAAAITPDSATDVVSGNWTAGPLSDNPPAAAYIKGYGIPVDPNASYGFSTNGHGTNELVAVAQTGNAIAARLYYGSALQASITYTRSRP